jgi:hypothetical protein
MAWTPSCAEASTCATVSLVGFGGTVATLYLTAVGAALRARIDAIHPHLAPPTLLTGNAALTSLVA